MDREQVHYEVLVRKKSNSGWSLEFATENRTRALEEAELALSEGNFDAAYKFGKLAIHIDVLDADDHRILGDALKGKKEFERAIVEYETALELKPNDSAVQTSLAETYADAGQAEKAGRLLDEILKKAPDSERTKELKQRIK